MKPGFLALSWSSLLLVVLILLLNYLQHQIPSSVLLSSVSKPAFHICRNRNLLALVCGGYQGSSCP